MDHYGWLADELTELWEQLEAPELKPDADDVQRLLLFAIEAANMACRARRKRAEEGAEAVPALPRQAPAPPARVPVRVTTTRRKRNGPEAMLGPVPFAIGFA